MCRTEKEFKFKAKTDFRGVLKRQLSHIRKNADKFNFIYIGIFGINIPNANLSDNVPTLN